MDYRAKNIVVCLDGTGNQIEENISNVLKLYRALDKPIGAEANQIVFYDQGVGTIGQTNTWGVLRQKFTAVWGLATGLGLDDNVLRAYDFIVRHFREERVKGEDGQTRTVRDRICIFGYSRGAHTARVLAAFIHNIGILKPEQLHLSGAALTAYKRANANTGDGEIAEFRRITQTNSHAVHFLGLWDTVSSMIIPKPGRLLMPSVENLKNTSDNPGVRVCRHAMSIDEARYMFRVDAWKEGQEFKPNPYLPEKVADQDCEQVWFAGHHGDIGGGDVRQTSGMSQFALCWMIREAMKNDLLFNTRMVDYVAMGVPYTSTTEYLYPEPDHTAPLHGARKSAWAVLEYIPKLKRFREKSKSGKKRAAAFGFYLPKWEPRFIPEGARIHAAAIRRRAELESYAPVNFPDTFVEVPHDSRPSSQWLK